MINELLETYTAKVNQSQYNKIEMRVILDKRGCRLEYRHEGMSNNVASGWKQWGGYVCNTIAELEVEVQKQIDAYDMPYGKLK